MREAIGGAWLTGLVITFIVFFASFFAVSINYSKAFNIKNNIVDLISKYEGNNNCAREKISDYLTDTGYLVAHTCPVDDAYNYTGYNLNGEPVSRGQKAYYCISTDSTDNTTILQKKFYRVVIFFRLDLPFVGDLFTFKIRGETESIYFPNDRYNLTCS